MAKALVVAEKPSVAKDIAAALGGFVNHETHLESDDFVVSWAVGHLLELLEPEELDPKYKRWLLEDLPILPDGFKLKPKSGQSERLRALSKLFARAEVKSLVNACDAGREGELIFRELVQHFEVKKPSQRLWLQSMTGDAIRKGFANLRPGSEFDGLGDAAFCRAESDWLIGMNATRALTRRMKTRTETTAWSAGRVQTPTLALLAEREVEVLTHRPEPYWRILANFQAPSHKYVGTWFDPKFKSDPDSPRKDDWITDEAVLNKILEEVNGKPGQAKETRKPKRESAPPLFDLTSLQRESNRRFGFSARRTLQAAQRLYEAHKLLTYPRTDSRCLPNDYTVHVDSVIGKLSNSGGDYANAAKFLQKKGLQNSSKIFDDSKVSDHFAIIPTEQMAAPNQLEGDDLRVYDLVMRRFLAAFYPPAVWIEVERITQVANHSFRTRSRYLSELGWYEVYGKDSGEDKSLPPLSEAARELEEALTKGLSGDEVPKMAPMSDSVTVQNLGAESEAEETRPPARITEGRILSLMEHAGEQVKDDEKLYETMKGKGLGTPATRAEIIENLISKQYARRADKALRATTKGVLLIDLLKRIHMERLSSARLTGELEKRLEEVEQGQRQRTEYMAEIYSYATEVVEKARTFQYEDLYAKEPALGQCPTCKEREVFEQSRFYACSANTGKNSVCSFIMWKERSGRYIDRVTAKELLTEGKTPLLDGFLTAQGKGYKGTLVLTSDGVELLPEGSEGRAGGGGDEIDPNGVPLAPCPRDPDGGCRVFETTYNYKCEAKCIEEGGRRKIGVILPKVICSREISSDEAIAFFKEGKTAELTEFISRFGRPFNATLVLKENGRHGFEFAPREGKPARAPKEGAAPAKGKATKSKAKPKSKVAAKKTAAEAGEKVLTAKKAPAKKAAATKTAAAKKTTATKTTATKAKATATKAKAKKELVGVAAAAEPVVAKPRVRLRKPES